MLMQIAQQILFVALLIIAVVLFSKRIKEIRRNINLGRDEVINDHPDQRWKNVLLLAFGQQKMFRNPLVGFLHFFVYAGFIIINIEILEIILDGIFGTHRLFAGALGNIIDSTFYGITYHYASLFHGRVVDMFYFPLISGNFPSWVPIWGGEDFIFFRPVFNLADAAISVGVILILIYQKHYFKHQAPEVSSPNSEVVEE